MLWDGRIRTFEYRDQNPLPYHLATPHFHFSFDLILIKSNINISINIGSSSITGQINISELNSLVVWILICVNIELNEIS